MAGLLPGISPVSKWILLLQFLLICPSKSLMREEASSFYECGCLCWGVRARLTDSLITSLNTSTLLTTLEIPRTILFRSVLYMGCFTVLPLKAESRNLLGTSQKRFWMMTDCKSSAKRPPSLKGKDEVFTNIFFNFMCVYLYMHVHDCTCICRHVCTEARGPHQVTLPSRSSLSIVTQSPHDPVVHGCG